MTPEEIQTAVEGMGDIVTLMAAFTEKLVREGGYARVEAIRLTGDYLRALIVGSN